MAGLTRELMCRKHSIGRRRRARAPLQSVLIRSRVDLFTRTQATVLHQVSHSPLSTTLTPPSPPSQLSILSSPTRIPNLTRALLGPSLELNMAYSSVETCLLSWQLLFPSMQHHLSVSFISPTSIFTFTPNPLFQSPCYCPFHFTCRPSFASTPSSTPIFTFHLVPCPHILPQPIPLFVIPCPNLLVRLTYYYFYQTW
ncbi:uncharacterized protein B0H18DRAFT_648393 [Fomitopsis serialis]|uniref:uncharacterized protein n=1 Tax=Fomitopsis serialis TaxID=139415 RepID=UPI00200832BD|nr:uncharacterized protein B0H18DRAFT_648393 [Neoantrodia serialis]KAH9933520.1 hypothetical protein B0H18DRAFT_648393 [Neoantrodia serialis]